MNTPTLARVLVFSFDLPPSLNRLYRYGKNGVYMTDAGRNYKEYVVLTAYSQEAAVMEGALAVTLEFHGSTGDIDNYTKVLFDSLNGVAWHDDSQVMELHIYKRPTGKDDCWLDMRIEAQE